VVFAFDIDRGQLSVEAQSLQHPERSDAGTGSDLDDVAGMRHSGQQAERSTCGWRDRRDTEFLCTLTGLDDRIGFGGERFGEIPGRLSGDRPQRFVYVHVDETSERAPVDAGGAACSTPARSGPRFG